MTDLGLDKVLHTEAKKWSASSYDGWCELVAARKHPLRYDIADEIGTIVIEIVLLEMTPEYVRPILEVWRVGTHWSQALTVDWIVYSDGRVDGPFDD